MADSKEHPTPEAQETKTVEPPAGSGKDTPKVGTPSGRKSPQAVDSALRKIINSQVKNKELRRITLAEAKKIQEAKNEYQKDYKSCTDFVHKHIAVVMRVAAELYYVKEFRLYRIKYNTFQEYVDQEFSYCKSRAYQLINAHALADKLERDLEKPVITNESQARELLRLRYHDDNGSLNSDKTYGKQREIVEDILAKNENLPAQLIAEKVDEVMKVENQKLLDHKPADKRVASMNDRLGALEADFDNVFKLNLGAEKEKIKTNAINRLKALLEKIDKL